MQVLSNPKHELFAQGLAIGKTQEQSYIAAGYCANDARAKASRLMATNGNILGRVQELQQGAALKAELTIDDIVNELETARQAALANNNPSAMVSATMGKAKILGLIVDKTKTDLTMTTMELSESDKAEIAALAKQLDNDY